MAPHKECALNRNDAQSFIVYIAETINEMVHLVRNVIRFQFITQIPVVMYIYAHCTLFPITKVSTLTSLKHKSIKTTRMQTLIRKEGILISLTII